MSICCGQAAKAVKKAQSIAKGYSNYVKGTNKELSEGRLVECNVCENYKRGICTKCGCVIVVKTTVLDEHCPIGKW